MLVLHDAPEKLRGRVFTGMHTTSLTREKRLIEFSGPLRVAVGYGRVETVEQIEFAGDLVSNASRGPMLVEDLLNLNPWIECPRRIRRWNVGDSAKVVM